MRNFIRVILGIFTLTLLEVPFSQAGEGDLLSVEKISSFTKQDVDAIKTGRDIQSAVPSENGVTLYKVRYETRDVSGQNTTASGLLIVPEVQNAHDVTIVSYQHGTKTRKTDVPSNVSREAELAILFYGSMGYAVVASDYLGLGDSSGLHPYCHSETEATATLHMLMAGKKALANLGMKPRAEILLAGYSQGGHVTMALHRKLQQEPVKDIQVVASTPMAGPYDLEGASFEGIFSGQSECGSGCAAYVTLAMNSVYRLFENNSLIFAKPWADSVSSLFDGTKTFGEIAAALPSNPDDLFQKDFLTQLKTDPNSPLRKALRENSVFDWLPKAPIRLLHGKADMVVPYTNAEVAYKRIKELGGDIELINLGDQADHGSAVVPAHLWSLTWFKKILK